MITGRPNRVCLLIFMMGKLRRHMAAEHPSDAGERIATSPPFEAAPRNDIVTWQPDAPK